MDTLTDTPAGAAPPAVRRPFVLAAVMLASFMIAIEATIVSTAMPQIAGQLGDLHLYAWVFSSFLLAQTATTVVFGKLADLYGRRSVLLVGIGIFLIGSILCGMAWSLPSLIAFRLIQGLGAGAVQPVSVTVIGDLYPAHERGRVQGWLASVWGVSSVLGPLAGGLIIQHVSWAWIFWINVPIGLAAAAGFFLFLRETVSAHERSVDVAGAGLFAVAVAALMVALTEAGADETRATLVAASVCIVAGALFLAQERRARDPMIAVALWAHRSIAATNATTLFSGMAVIGLTTFLPMYVQAVMGRSPLEAGFMLTAMVLGWPIAATLGARNFARFGLRRILVFGAALLPLGAIAFVVLSPTMSPLVAGLGSLVMGFGMGFLSTAAIVLIQGSVGWAERGAATASNLFARNLGSTLGATVLGAVLNASLARVHGGSLQQIQDLLSRPGAAQNAVASRAGLAHGLHLTFWGVLLIASAALLLSLFVPQATTAQAGRDVTATTTPAGHGIEGRLTIVFAVACGLMVANLYYAQALIGEIAPALGLRGETAALAVTLTQLGYGAGLLFVVSLADLVENRRLILVMVAGAALGLAGMVVSRDAVGFLLFSVMTGFCSVGAQIMVPLAAHLAPEARRGRVVGNVMGGLIAGIMLARPAANALAAVAGWRAIFAVSSLAMVGLGLVLARLLPERRPSSQLHYGRILLSSLSLLVRTPVVRRRTAYQAILFAAFNLFWTAVPLLLAGRFGLGQIGIALFALAGAGGALAAPLAGRLGDRGHVRLGTAGALLAAVAAFVASVWAVDLHALLLLAAAAVLLDAATQFNQVLGQRVLYSIVPDARGRINASYMTVVFIGAACGSTLATWTFYRGDWVVTAWTGAAMAMAALLLFLTEPRGIGARLP